MKQYTIFDIDGTLNRTDLYAVEAYEKALEKRSRKVDREEIIACTFDGIGSFELGRNKTEIVQRKYWMR